MTFVKVIIFALLAGLWFRGSHTRVLITVRIGNRRAPALPRCAKTAVVQFLGCAPTLRKPLTYKQGQGPNHLCARQLPAPDAIRNSLPHSQCLTATKLHAAAAVLFRRLASVRFGRSGCRFWHQSPGRSLLPVRP